MSKLRKCCRYIFAIVLTLLLPLATQSGEVGGRITSPKELFGFNLGDDYCLAIGQAGVAVSFYLHSIVEVPFRLLPANESTSFFLGAALSGSLCAY